METVNTQSIITRFKIEDLLKRSDILASLGLVGILTLMIIPVPPIMLDLCLSFNITIAILILIISLYTQKAVEFSIFPSVLLATTLFRLSLNVASTRLILLRGHEGMDAAGSVIQSFGQFVVGGSYVVGLVIFIILVIINFVVITKGAGRIAEVAARFTLDAMPGKQMAIDADLNAGLIDEQTARDRREEISNEANFHGAMDGASKFVRGDAIAGIIITLINIGAGFIIGILQKGMPMAEAAQNYTILTIGDGLVGQVPALIISTAAGMLVTRSAGKDDFGAEMKAQFTRYSKALWVVSAILLAFALIPGMPFFPFLVIASGLAYTAYKIDKAEKEEIAAKPLIEEPEPAVQPDEDYEQMLNVDLIELEVGYGLIPFVDAAQDGELLQRIQSIRKQFAITSGFIVPPVHIKDNLQLNPNQYTISLKGVQIATAEMMPGYCMAMDPGMVTETIKGIPTQEPAFQLPAIWITDDKREQAQIAGYTVVDCTTVMTTHISEIIKQHAHELLGRQETQNLIDNLARTYPKLIEELVPNILNLGSIMRVLQNLLRENVSIRDLRSILETMADYTPMTQDTDTLTEYVRHALSRSISVAYTRDDGTMSILTMDRNVEDTIQTAVQHREHGSYLALDPAIAQKILDSLGSLIANYPGGQQPALLVTPQIRPHVRRLTERYFPSLAVLSHNEITTNINIQSVGTVNIDAS
ncbi:flagellar biosynthesis protein FlhA [Desulfogranum marinum]|uniref:flagellar biosynthesis protein FlhA n=1 Tax=Desulfogranum marinum TaxID=453220 RepID=UPI0019661161|nr:flagellar biosynthesis protein FlhA [Desulfogranum marinum]MBM9513173.1 flagellar biosynthesis protein FlhA [Desulfogranum marinum]